MIDKDIILEVSNLNKTYKVPEYNISSIKSLLTGFLKIRKFKKIHALKNINFKVYEGETLGIIGSNGSGKSTLLNIILGAILPDKDSVLELKGKVLKLALGTGIDPNLTAEENIIVNSSVLGLRIEEIEKLIPKIIEFSELQEFRHVAVKYFSKGMKHRLTFAIAMQSKVGLLLLDEFFGSVGDASFRRKSTKIFKRELIDKKTVIMVSHSMAQIKTYCSRVIWIKNGEIIMEGDPEKVIEKYLND